MSDFLNIRVTQRELELIMDLLHEAGDRTDADGQPAIELCHDLMEQSGDVADGDAEMDMIDAGIQAREQLKQLNRARSATQTHDVWESPSARPFADSDVRTGSVAADRRTEALMRGTASPVANDPIDW